MPKLEPFDCSVTLPDALLNHMPQRVRTLMESVMSDDDDMTSFPTMDVLCDTVSKSYFHETVRYIFYIACISSVIYSMHTIDATAY